MTPDQKAKIYLDFTKGNFGDHEYSENLQKIYKNYKKELSNFRGCSACHRRRVNRQYRDLVINKLLNSESESE